MKGPTLIGLTGRAGSGKDTVRQILENRHGRQGLAFADPIRAMVGGLIDQNPRAGREYMQLRELKERPIPGLGVSYRHLAQTLGTEWGRYVSSNFWLTIAAESMANAWAWGDATHFVISDVRFPNEAAWVREQGGAIWRIERQAATPVRAHESETHIEQISADRVIHNDGPIPQLQLSVALALI